MSPTVGQTVHVYTTNTAVQSNGVGVGPYAAIVTQVFSADCVNAVVFPPFGAQWETASVLRDQPESSQWWSWAPRV